MVCAWVGVGEGEVLLVAALTIAVVVADVAPIVAAAVVF